jgi:hypothetical protein
MELYKNGDKKKNFFTEFERGKIKEKLKET